MQGGRLRSLRRRAAAHRARPLLRRPVPDHVPRPDAHHQHHGVLGAGVRTRSDVHVPRIRYAQRHGMQRDNVPEHHLLRADGMARSQPSLLVSRVRLRSHRRRLHVLAAGRSERRHPMSRSDLLPRPRGVRLRLAALLGPGSAGRVLHLRDDRLRPRPAARGELRHDREVNDDRRPAVRGRAARRHRAGVARSPSRLAPPACSPGTSRR